MHHLFANAIIVTLDLKVTDETLIKTLAEPKIFHQIAHCQFCLWELDQTQRFTHMKLHNDQIVKQWKHVI
jgi:hypothetical protein